MLSKNPTIGCDVEFAAQTTQTNLFGSGTYIPLKESMLAGTKEKPNWIDDLSFQRDNVFAEIGMLPADNKEDFVSRIMRARDQLNILLEPTHLVHGLDSHVVYDLMSLKEVDQYDAIGCEPDYNVWSLTENPAPLLEELGASRTCGGHIHIGYPDFEVMPPTAIDRINLVKACDVFIGLWLKGTGHLDTFRQQFYGKAGAHRPKEYGIEYRVPSNAWAKNENMIGMMYEHAVMAFNHHHEIDSYINMLGGDEIIIDLIDSAPSDEAYDAAVQVAAA